MNHPILLLLLFLLFLPLSLYGRYMEHQGYLYGVGTVHNTEHVSQSLDWGKKKFHHIDHIYIKPRDKDLDHSERMRYPQGSGYGAYCWASRDTWKVDGSSGW